MIIVFNCFCFSLCFLELILRFFPTTRKLTLTKSSLENSLQKNEQLLPQLLHCEDDGKGFFGNDMVTAVTMNKILQSHISHYYLCLHFISKHLCRYITPFRHPVVFTCYNRFKVLEQLYIYSINSKTHFLKKTKWKGKNEVVLSTHLSVRCEWEQ